MYYCHFCTLVNNQTDMQPLKLVIDFNIMIEFELIDNRILYLFYSFITEWNELNKSFLPHLLYFKVPLSPMEKHLQHHHQVAIKLLML